jgi:cytochrome c556
MTRAIWIGVLCLFAATAAQAADDEAYIEYRQELMEGIGADMGAVSDILKYKLPLTENIKGHADAMVAHADLIGPAFEHEVTAGKTDAKPEIWQERGGFAKAIADFKAASTKFAEVARGGDLDAMVAQFKELGKACGGCHKPFRKPEEESFHRH